MPICVKCKIEFEEFRSSPSPWIEFVSGDYALCPRCFEEDVKVLVTTQPNLCILAKEIFKTDIFQRCATNINRYLLNPGDIKVTKTLKAIEKMHNIMKDILND